MAIKMLKENDKSLLTIDGELTIYTASEYNQYLLENFSGVEEIDTCGLQILAVLSKELSDKGNDINIVATSDVAKEALEISRLMTDMTFNSEGAQA